MAKRARKSYTEAQRQTILATAAEEGLTAEGVKKQFGVTPVTYYSWRKKNGIKGPRGRRPANRIASTGGDLGSQLRAGVQNRVREILPKIVQEEVAGYLDSFFGGSKARRRRGPAKKK